MANEWEAGYEREQSGCEESSGRCTSYVEGDLGGGEGVESSSSVHQHIHISLCGLNGTSSPTRLDVGILALALSPIVG